MKLYHGGSVVVQNPQPVSPEKNRPLKTYVLWDQYLFHSEKALKYLKFIGRQE